MKRIAGYFALIMLVLAATGCFRFQQVHTKYQQDHPTNWPAYVQQRMLMRPELIVHDKNNVAWRLNGAQLNGTLLSGTLEPANDTYPYLTKSTFARSRYSYYFPGIHQRIHLRTMLTLDYGPFQADLSQAVVIQYVSPNHALNGFGYTLETIVGTYGTLIVIVLIACNCPKVYTDGANGPIYHGTLFPGAISRSLERQEKLPLAGIAPGDSLHLTIRNEQPEEEYLDEVKLLRTRIAPGHTPARDSQGELFSYEKLVQPLFARTNDGQSVKPLIATRDTATFGFDANPQPDRLNALYLTFARQDLGQTPKLVIHGQQTAWVDSLSMVFMQQFGTSFDEWTAWMDRVPRERYDRNSALRGISMNAELWTGETWQHIGAFHYAGNTAEKALGLDLPLATLAGDSVRIRLTAAHRLWSLNAVGIAPNWTPLRDFEEVPLLSATDQDGQPVAHLLQQADNQYVLQKALGAQLSLVFATNSLHGDNVLYVLQSEGFYHHIRTFDHAPNKPLLRAMRKSPLTTQQFSLLMSQQPAPAR